MSSKLFTCGAVFIGISVYAQSAGAVSCSPLTAGVQTASPSSVFTIELTKVSQIDSLVGSVRITGPGSVMRTGSTSPSGGTGVSSATIASFLGLEASDSTANPPMVSVRLAFPASDSGALTVNAAKNCLNTARQAMSLGKKFSIQINSGFVSSTINENDPVACRYEAKVLMQTSPEVFANAETCTVK